MDFGEGGDLNYIQSADEKKEGRVRTESSHKGFKEFIEKMEIVEIAFQGRQCIWANNWENESYIEVRLGQFFGASQWWMEYDKDVVMHIERQSSDYSLLILDANPNQGRRKPRFYFDKRLVHKPGIEDVVKNHRTWNVRVSNVQGGC